MNFKNLLLSTSILAFLASPAMSTKKLTEDLADRETNQEAVISKLRGSGDFTITLDVDREVETIKDMVVAYKAKNDKQGQKPTSQELSEISFNAKHRMINNLDYLKTHRVDVGAGWSTTTNKHRSLCVENADIPLVYPTFRAERDLNDSYLPVGARGNFTSKPLYDHIKAYVGTLGLTVAQSKRLYANLEPLFYITQQEAMKLIEGGDNPYHRPRWVYGKDREGIIDAVKGKVTRHNDLISLAGLVGFNRVNVQNVLVPDLVGMALDLIPLQLREIYNDGRHSFRIGRNYKNAPSLIHPQIDNLPYPVLSNHRINAGKVLSDMNLPVGYVAHPTIANQWNRVADFVMADGRIAVDEKQNMIKLLEPVGYLFRHAVQGLRILADQYPEREEAIERLTGLAMTYATTHNIPEDVLNVFYNGRVNLHTLIQDMKVKSARHEGMVSDLLPVGLRGGIATIRNNLLEALVFHDMVDRFKLFYPYDVPRLG